MNTGVMLMKKLQNIDNRNRYYLSSEVRSYSHELNEEAFKLLKSGKSILKISNIKKDSFNLQIEYDPNNYQKEHNLHHAYLIISSFLVGINIATLGHFFWAHGDKQFWTCEKIEPDQKTERIIIQNRPFSFPAKKRLLTEDDIRDTIKISGAEVVPMSRPI
jgi:hypothetical protein